MKKSKRYAAALLSVMLAVALMPQAALGASPAKTKQPAVTETLRGFSAYTATKDCICLHWNYLAEADGVLLYRADSAKGTFKRIAKVKADPDTGYEYHDTKVEPGKTYYYKARPYQIVKGKLIKGKLTKVSKKKAVYYHAATEAVDIQQIGEKEVVLCITLAGPGFDTEMFCVGGDAAQTDRYEELGLLELIQSWRSGAALEKRITQMQIIGLSLDGEEYQTQGGLKVPAGSRVYLKAAAGEVLALGSETSLDWNIPCFYHGKYEAISSLDD